MEKHGLGVRKAFKRLAKQLFFQRGRQRATASFSEGMFAALGAIAHDNAMELPAEQAICAWIDYVDEPPPVRPGAKLRQRG